MFNKNAFYSLCAGCVFLGLSVSNSTPVIAQSPPDWPDIDISGTPDGIVPMPDNVHEVFKVFDRYTKVITPNGKAIHMVIAPGYSNRQTVYARKVLVNHLTGIAGTKYGEKRDKIAVANAIAANNSVLTFYPDTEMHQGHRPNLRAAGVLSQDLRAYETILEGVEEYMDQENPTRDASYEEIMHFVQGKGLRFAHPTFIRELNEAHDIARAKDLYNRNTTGEYWICGFEAYFDMWRHDPTGEGTRGGEYIPLDNFKLKALDPAMYELVENYLGTHWLYTAEIVDEFEGTFSLTRDENSTYTNKSQFLRKAMLTGRNDANLTGNDEDNNLFGNSGDNVMTPMAGSDVVDGGPGNDTASFPGDRKDYIVHEQDGRVIVEGIDFMRDGYNILINIEKLRFNDRDINTGDL